MAQTHLLRTPFVLIIKGSVQLIIIQGAQARVAWESEQHVGMVLDAR